MSALRDRTAFAIFPDSIVKQQSPMSSPGLTGRSSIPETPVLRRDASGVLDPPLAAFAKAFAISSTLRFRSK